MPYTLDSIEFSQREIDPIRHLLPNNGLYNRLQTLADLRRLVEHQVLAVWDFMSLPKAPQRDPTRVGVPWVPTANAATRRLISETVSAART